MKFLISIKRLLFTVMIPSFALSAESDSLETIDKSLSYGFLSEKIPFALVDYSYLYNIDKNSEFYTSLYTMIFISGAGAGYKYYFKDKFTDSIFISSCIHLSYAGTAQDGMMMYGVSFSPGYSIVLNQDSKSLKHPLRPGYISNQNFIEYLYKKTSINIGLSYSLFGDNSSVVFPYISLERRF